MTANAICDIVNFNADASCLSNARWLEVLEGGVDSAFCQWLSLYVEYGKRVTLGIPGATLADIKVWNPEAIDLINQNSDCFEVLVRPFAHDICLMRTPNGFEQNLSLGIKAIRQEFTNVLPVYLPPEFMCNSQHVAHLAETGIDAAILHPGRFDDSVGAQIPPWPFSVGGVGGTTMRVIPVVPTATQQYLNAIQTFDAAAWNSTIQSQNSAGGYTVTWRDGESVFLLPDSVSRERAWLEGEVAERISIAAVLEQETRESQESIEHYPIHPFSAWIREMKMYWFIDRVSRIEEGLASLSDFQRYLWLQLINSDILSSVEKRAPVVRICSEPGATPEPFTIARQPKAFIGEEYLNLMGRDDNSKMGEFYATSPAPHMRLLRGRVSYLEKLGR